MEGELADLLKDMMDKSKNGVSLLLEAVDKVRPDMPPECQDDITFGALVVIHQLGIQRGKRTARVEVASIVLAGLMVLTWLAMIALHGSVPWLSALFQNVSGV